jgi:hypothetical protein
MAEYMKKNDANTGPTPPRKRVALVCTNFTMQTTVDAFGPTAPDSPQPAISANATR